jgi:hypothetical protein
MRRHSQAEPKPPKLRRIRWGGPPAAELGETRHAVLGGEPGASTISGALALVRTNHEFPYFSAFGRYHAHHYVLPFTISRWRPWPIASQGRAICGERWLMAAPRLAGILAMGFMIGRCSRLTLGIQLFWRPCICRRCLWRCGALNPKAAGIDYILGIIRVIALALAVLLTPARTWWPWCRRRYVAFPLLFLALPLLARCAFPEL